MKYLAIAEHCFLDVPTGASRVAWDMLNLMQRQGHETALICQRAGSMQPLGWHQEAGVQVFRFERKTLPIWHPGRLTAIIDAGRAAGRAASTGRRWDVVHVHAPVIGLGALDGISGAHRVISTIHSPSAAEQVINWRDQGAIGQLKTILGRHSLNRIERNLLHASDSIHVLSAFTQSQLFAAHGTVPGVSIIPHWITDQHGITHDRESARKLLGWPVDKFIFFSLRQLRRRYGLDVAIRASAQLPRDSGWRFYIGGQGNLRQLLEQQISQFDLSQYVHLLGRVPDGQLGLAYLAADVFVLPTIELECFGLIILEALGVGCPVIGTDAGAIPEVLNRVQPGAIARAGDEWELGSIMRQVLEKKLLFPSRKELMQKARAVYGSALVEPRILEFLQNNAFPSKHSLTRKFFR